MHNPKPNEIYQNIEGKLYKIIANAVHPETGEEMIVYQALHSDYKVYVMELASFLSPADRTKYPEAEQRYCFEPVEQIVGQAAVKMEKPQAVTDSAAPKEAGREKTDRIREKVTEGEDHITQSQIDPLVLEFLESDTYEEKLTVLAELHPRITDEMINTLAVAIDVEVGEGELEERYAQLRSCILTFDRFECSRLR